jgi:hypothetical protein
LAKTTLDVHSHLFPDEEDLTRVAIASSPETLSLSQQLRFAPLESRGKVFADAVRLAGVANDVLAAEFVGRNGVQDRRGELRPQRVTGLQRDVPIDRYESHDWSR